MGLSVKTRENIRYLLPGNEYTYHAYKCFVVRSNVIFLILSIVGQLCCLLFKEF